jgi:cytochrome c553
MRYLINPRRSRALGVALALALSAAPTLADEPDPLTRDHANHIAVTVCGTCHGATGISEQPKYPRLAGQNANYLTAQLKAFRSQSRGDPDAVGYMWGMSAALEDGTIEALGSYYAGQAAGGGHAGDSKTLARGREIYDKGVEAVGVPACAACHGPDAHGIADFPRLAGQHSQYVLKQLNSFQNNMRNVAVMHGVAQGLKEDEMRSVAAYLESLP